MELLKDRLKKRREEVGLSQIALAKKAHVKNQSIIAGLETGSRKSSSYIPAIAAAIGVDALWLATGKGDKRAGVATTTTAIALLPEAVFHEAAKLLALMDEYDSDVWITKLKCSAEVQRAEARAAANKARRKLEEDRVGAATSSADPPLGRRRTA